MSRLSLGQYRADDGMDRDSENALISRSHSNWLTTMTGGLVHGQLFDVHGAGEQRSDSKTGPREHYPEFFGPQGDVRHVYNYVRCVKKVE